MGGHLSWRDPSQFMVGIMAGAGTGTVDGCTKSSCGEDFQAFLFGVEGQLYLDDTTLFKQVGIVRADEDGSEELDLFFVRKGVRHFFDNGWTADGELGFAWGTFDGGNSGLSDVSIVSWGVGVEKQLQTQMPISLFARYEGALYTLDNCSASMTEHRIMGGIRIAFGVPDAKTQNRLGANTDLPRFPTFAAVDVLEYCRAN